MPFTDDEYQQAIGAQPKEFTSHQFRESFYFRTTKQTWEEGRKETAV